MFISKLEGPENRGNHSLTSKCRFRNNKIHELHYVLKLKTQPVAFLFPLFLADVDMKYRNEIEMIKNNSVTSMEYVYLLN